MAMPSRVQWAEGLFLRRQHFQQQGSYHEARVTQMAHDTLRLDALSAIFRDGEISVSLAGAPLLVARSISVHVPAGIRDLRLEPIAVTA